MSLSAILLFILILLVLVIIHEFGHFIAAKWVGMRVDEFAFGFPPRVYSKKVGETTYAINALPLGGYVAIWGENGEPDDVAKNHPRAFSNRPKWQQIAVLVAGVTMNMILALIIFIAVSFGKVEMSTANPTYGSRVQNTFIMVVEADPLSPAYRAGIAPGSIITKMTSAGQTASLASATSVVSFVEVHQDTPFAISYIQPNGTRSSTTVAAVYGIVPDRKALGLSLDSVGYIHTTLLEAVKIGSIRTYDTMVQTVQGLGTLVTSIGKSSDVLSSLSGPIGIARIVGQTSAYGIGAVMTLVALLSVNLAIFNILPLPALDGGRIVVVIIEAVTRKRVPFKYYSWVNILGFAALMLLLVGVTINDIRR